jgi:hypothetical protein
VAALPQSQTGGALHFRHFLLTSDYRLPATGHQDHRLPAPRPPIPDHERTVPAITRRSATWIAGISLAIAAMVWLTLFEIKSVAEDDAPTTAETAQCRAELDPASATDPEAACPSGPDIIWAARHPVRNAIAILLLSAATGVIALLLNSRLR